MRLSRLCIPCWLLPICDGGEALRDECVDGGEDPGGRCGGAEVRMGVKRSATWLETTIAQSWSRARLRSWCPNCTSWVERSPSAAPAVEEEERSAR